eukprot:jgi/Psemu1/34429/gm1.34429_g
MDRDHDENEHDEERIMIEQSTRHLDPNKVDSLIAKELNEMSLEKRERVLEEIHGVSRPITIAEEDRLLEEMQMELDDLERKCSAKETANATCKTTTTTTTTDLPIAAYLKAKMLRSEWIQDRQFRLSFLNREYNNPKKAAICMIRYLHFLVDCFTKEDILMRPIHLKDIHPHLSEYCSDLFSSVLFLPIRDPSGRRIVAFLREPDCTASLATRLVLEAYTSQVLAEDRKGVVAIYFLHDVNFESISIEMMEATSRIMKILPVRFDAIHICCPDLPMYRMCMALLALQFGKEHRIRRRLHFGSYEECKYSLHLLGICVNRLPLNLQRWKWSYGTDSRLRHNWLAMREFLEAKIRAKLDESENDQNVENIGALSRLRGYMNVSRSVRSQYVECPHREDCLFGKGKFVMNLAGNIAMRRLVTTSYDRFCTSKSNAVKRELTWSVIYEIKKGGGRFLKEDPNNPGLYIQANDQSAVEKVTGAFRNLKKKKIRETKQQRNRNDLLLSPGEQLPCAATTTVPTAFHDIHSREAPPVETCQRLVKDCANGTTTYQNSDIASTGRACEPFCFLP